MSTVLIITPSVNGFGGVEAFNRRLSSTLKELGYTVSMLSGEDATYNVKNPLLLKMTRYLGNAILVKSYLRSHSHDYDCIICSAEFGLGVHGNNVIGYYHGAYYGLEHYLKKYSNVKQRIYFKAMAFLQSISARKKMVLCVSEFVSNLLAKQHIKVDRVINNCVDCNTFCPRMDIRSDRYLFVGRFDYYGKGIDIIKELQTFYEIDVYTDGEHSEVKNCIKSNFTDTQMAEIYNSHRILLFFSRFEASSLTTIEAMACGLPVLIFNVGIGPQLKKEIPEFVVGNNSCSIDEIKKRITDIENDYIHFSERAREYALKHHRKELFVNAISECVDKCVRKSAGE